jgi:hypothetical protein
MIRLSALVLSGFFFASPAAAWLAPNNQTIEQESESRFSVAARPGLSATQAFCAAGDYAVQALNLSPDARLWRVTPPPRRMGQGIGFSTTPEGAAGRTGLFLFGTDDGSVSVGFAQSLCWTQARLR